MHHGRSSRTQGFKDKFLTKEGYANEQKNYPNYYNTNYDENGDVGTHPQKMQHREYQVNRQHSFLAAGDGYDQFIKKTAHVRNIPIQRAQNRNSTFTASAVNSSRSSSTPTTTIERNRKGEELLQETHSKANLLQTIEQGLTDIDKKYRSNIAPVGVGPRLSKDTFNRIEAAANDCVSFSAGVINEKVIHPLITKFRLLYLHNIKEEVSIMEDLEKLPDKLHEVCRGLEKE